VRECESACDLCRSAIPQVTGALKASATPNTITLHRNSKRCGTPNLFLFTNY
jgi:hypothetical protein